MRLPWKDRPGHAVAWKIHSRPSGAARWCINTIPFNRRPSSAPIPSSSRDRRSKSLDCLVNVMRTLEELCQIQPLARYNTMATLDRSSSTVVPAPIRPTCAKSVTTDVKKRKSECAKVKLPSKDGVLGMLLAAANNGAVIPLALQQVEGKGDSKSSDDVPTPVIAAPDPPKTAPTKLHGKASACGWQSPKKAPRLWRRWRSQISLWMLPVQR